MPPSPTTLPIAIADEGFVDLEATLEVDWRPRAIEPSETPQLAPGEAFRAAPLLYVWGTGGERWIAIGQLQIHVSSSVRMVAVIHGVWSEKDGWHNATQGAGESERPDLLSVLASDPPFVPHKVTSREPQNLAAFLAKASSEASREAVAMFREARYDLEGSLAQASRGSITSLAPDLGSLLELSLAANRARDTARGAVRSGFALHLTDDEAYQRYRRASDPSIINPHPPADHTTRPWMRQHDAGVRQCEAMDSQLREECERLGALLSAATTLSAVHEAKSQETFNTVAGVAAIGLGLPALVLALYSAAPVTPLNSPLRLLALLPVAVGAILAAAVMVVRLSHAGSLMKRAGWAIAAVLSLMTLLGSAGWLATYTVINSKK